MKFWRDCFKCAACEVQSSGEVAFAQHCLGKAHASKAGFRGFAGLVPNDGGVVPSLRDELLVAMSKALDRLEREGVDGTGGAGAKKGTGGEGGNKGGGGESRAAGPPTKPAEKLERVGVSHASERMVREALHKSASSPALVAAVHPTTRAAGTTAPPPKKEKEKDVRIAAAAAAIDREGIRCDDGDRGEVRRGGSKPNSPFPVPRSLPAPAPGAFDAPSLVGNLRPVPRGASAAGRASGRVSEAAAAEEEGQVSVATVTIGGRSSDGGKSSGPARGTSEGPPPAASGGGMGPMAAQRRSLPVFSFRDRLIRTIGKHRVCVVEGDTGSGKTTQVPQFLLEEAHERGAHVNIVMSQPRRISAMSVAERVAAERGERVGGVVGYSIRLESKSSADTRLLFCTTGILLKRLEEDPDLVGVTHVFVDEVHERSLESDFLLMVLRDLLRRRGDDPACPKVVLMSATLDAALFNRYFEGAPSVKFPGRAYPVTDLYLEDALELTRHVVRPGADWARKKGGPPGAAGGRGNGGGGPTHAGVCHDFTLGRCSRRECAFSHGDVRGRAEGPGGAGLGLRSGSDVAKPAPSAGPLNEPDDEALGLPELAARYPLHSATTHASLKTLDHDAIDYELVSKVVQWAATTSVDDAARWAREKLGRVADAQPNQPKPDSAGPSALANAVLVFLPGLKEITALQEELARVPVFSREPAASWVLPLHSTVPPEDQRRVFEHAPSGVTKVILATNIAETAVTVDDVAFVVDTGRMKETRFDPQRRMSSLEDVPVSRANAKQRRGRAGRVRSGVAVHLFTSHRHRHVLASAQSPEVQRVPLEQLALRIKALRYPGTIADVCARLVEPPAAAAVDRAVAELVSLGALEVVERDVADEDPRERERARRREVLTPLGTHLSTLPVDARIGKLILFGAMFGVADEALTIAAILSHRSPFMSPPQKRDEADQAKRTFAVGGAAMSDHLTALRAYQTCDRLGGGRYDFAREHFLGIKTLQMVAGLKRQLLELLSAAGFAPPNLRARSVESLGRRVDGTDGVALALAGGLASGSRGNGGRGGDGGCFRCGGPHLARECVAASNLGQSEGSGGRGGGRGDPKYVPPHVAASVPGPQGADDAWRADAVTFPLLRALLVAALYPQVVAVELPAPKAGKKVSADSIKFLAREEGSAMPVSVALHPSCVAAKQTTFTTPYLIYHERVKTTRVYLRDATPVSPCALLLFGGGDLLSEKGKAKGPSRAGNWRGDDGSASDVISLDGWIRFRCPASTQALIRDVRAQLNEVLKRKIETPKLAFSDSAKGLMEAVAQLVSEG